MVRQVDQVPMLIVGEAGPERIIPFSLGANANDTRSAEEWECEYCGRTNRGGRLECIGCGGPKHGRPKRAPSSKDFLFLQGISEAQWERVVKEQAAKQREMGIDTAAGFLKYIRKIYA